MTPTIAAVLAALLAVVGLIGIIVAVLPGSITILVGLVVWAVWGGSSQAVVFAIVAGALVLAGMTAGAVLTTRNLDAREIPQWPIMLSLVGAVIGSFALPGFGLPIGFVVVLLLAELVRVKNLRTALSTSWVAVRSLSLGILIELGLALPAIMLLGISVFWTFV